MNKPISLGLIGCGLRGTGYISYLRRLKIAFTVDALADIDIKNLENANRDFAYGKAKLFKTGEDLLHYANVDAVIIATPNIHHRGPVIATIKKGLPFLIEKPIATSFEDLSDIWNTYIQYKGRACVGFGLRFAPFYKAIKEVIRKGTLGQILSIHAEELMSDRLSMIFCRSPWRPDAAQSGGLLLEKCCHDIDLLNWLCDDQAVRLSSYSNQRFLTPDKGPDRTCDTCSDEQNCRFSRRRTLNSFKVNITETQTENHALYSVLINNKCPYFIGSPYPDHQSVMIEYSNGILCTFNVIQVQPANRRTIHILGSDARLYGILEENCFTVYHRTGPNDEKPERIKIHTDDTGHSGADGALTRDFLDLINKKPNPSRPGLKEGIESAIMCLAADKSAELGHSIALSELRSQVFDIELLPQPAAVSPASVS